MERVTDRVSNPFGMSAPAEPAVYGYGDANADFHIVGCSPASHGGATTGVPFTESTAGRRLQNILHDAGFATTPYHESPDLTNCYLSYLRLSPGDPDDLEPYLDAELRALNAHVLLPIGEEAISYIFAEHTTWSAAHPIDARSLHAGEVRGRGFLVVPVAEPAEWEQGDGDALVERLRALLASDYRQTKGVATTVG